MSTQVIERLEAPADMNFAERADETVGFFASLIEHARKTANNSGSLVVDMSDTQRIAPEVALVIRSIVDQLAWMPSNSLYWMRPQSGHAIRSLSSVGFEWRASVVPDDEMQPVAAGILAAPQVMYGGKSTLLRIQTEMDHPQRQEMVNEYIDENLQVIFHKAIKGFDLSTSKSLKTSVLTGLYEAIYNVGSHAYPLDFVIAPPVGSSSGREFDWWIGVFGMSQTGRVQQSNCAKVVVCVLDHGVSIPQNIRQGIETGSAFIKKTSVLGSSPSASNFIENLSDKDIMSLLLNGSIDRKGVRTSTGLASLKEPVQDGFADSLSIATGTAFVRFSKGSADSQSAEISVSDDIPEFPGTLIWWRFKLEGANK